jgi:aspartate/methionine/tyrosine aminotransferase
VSLRAARRMEGIERTLIRRIFDAAPPDAIQLGLGQPDLVSPPSVCLAGVQAIAEGRTGYTSTAGDPELRALVAGRYRPWVPGPEGIAITIGSQEAMFAACLTLLDPGDELLYPDPGYPAYPVVARLVGATAVPYPLRAERAFRLLPEDVLSRITERTRLAIVCSPGNPTGAIHRKEVLEALCTGLRRAGVAWLSDEIYSGYCYEASCPSPMEICAEGGLVISGLSKDLSMTGWRIGWVAGPPAIVARVIAAHQYLVTCAPTPSQRAALAAFRPAGEEERRAILERFRLRRRLMAEGLSRVPGVRFALPDGAFYFFVDVSAHGSSLEVARRLLERRKVVTIPGEAFGPGGAGWLRLSYAASEEAIEEGTARIARELGA